MSDTIAEIVEGLLETSIKLRGLFGGQYSEWHSRADEIDKAIAALSASGVDSDDQRCLRCGLDALDTGWECTECAYDNMPHYCTPKEVPVTDSLHTCLLNAVSAYEDQSPKFFDPKDQARLREQCRMIRAHAATLEGAALSGGGVDDAMVERACAAYDAVTPTHGSHKGFRQRMEAALAAAPKPSEPITQSEPAAVCKAAEGMAPVKTDDALQQSYTSAGAWRGGDPQPSLTVPSGDFMRMYIPATPLLQINSGNNSPLVKIHPDGLIEYGPNYTPDAAAEVFWEALAWLSPIRKVAADHARIVAELRESWANALDNEQAAHHEVERMTVRADALAGVLARCRDDYRAGLGISREHYEQFCRMGAMGNIPNDTWPRHFQTRISEIDALLSEAGK